MSESNDSLTAKLDDLGIDRSSGVKTRRPWLWFALIAIAGGGCALAAYVFLIAPSNVLSVDTAVVRSAKIDTPDDSVLDGTGYVVARRQATVSAKTTGKVLEVLIEEGMHVDEGQLLAKLDDKLLQMQIDLARANLEQTKAQLLNVQIRRDDGVKVLQRMQTLRQDELVAESDVDEAVLNVDSLNAELDLLDKSVAVSERQLALQQYFVEETEIRAPFAGVVIAKTAQPGEMISPVSAGGGFTRTGICTIVDMNSIEVEVDVQERFINRVYPKQPATVTLNAYSDTRLPAEVIAIIPAADRGSSTVRVRIGFLERDERVLPDMAVSVAFLEEGAEVKRVVTPSGVDIPVSALFYEGEENERSFVWVIEDERVQRRDVQLESTDAATARILSGLRRGEVVVTNVQDYDVIMNGQQISVRQ